MRKIYDSSEFYPQEDIDFYLNPEKLPEKEWGEPPTKEELIELFDNWPSGTRLYDVFPHCRICFKYPIAEDNIYLYKKLTETKDYRGLFDPLDFFNLLYENLKYCLDHVNSDQQRIIDHLTHLNLVRRKMHFFLYSLHYIISGLNGPVTADKIWPAGIYTVKNENLGLIDLEIISAYQSLEKELGIETESTDLPNVKIREAFLSTRYPSLTRLKLSQIALIYVYEKKIITRDNASEIAEIYGFVSKNSGEKLYHEYLFFASKVNRRAVPETAKTIKNKINLFEEILPNLSEGAKEWASDEIKILKIIQSNKYS